MRVFKIILLLLFFSRLQAQNYFPSSGAVGIGTSSPAFPLHVIGASRFESVGHFGETFDNIIYGKGIQITRPADQGDNLFHLSFIRAGHHIVGMGYLKNSGTFAIQPGDNNTTPAGIFLTPSGNIGIGLSNPTHLLEIASPLGSTVFDAANIGFTRNSYNYITASDSLGSLVFRTGGSGNARMIISPTGNIGIGTLITTNYKLTVEGAIAARKIRVTQSSGWADFVFEPGYKLVSLEETACFIKTNKHLPDVPTASEVANDGQDLGDMNRILLQKVEELTLHLIDVNEKSKQQQEMINQLMEMVKQLQTASKSK